MNFKNSIIPARKADVISPSLSSNGNGLHDLPIDLESEIGEPRRKVSTNSRLTVTPVTLSAKSAKSPGATKRPTVITCPTLITSCCCWPCKSADNSGYPSEADMISSSSKTDPANPGHRHKHFDTTVKETFASLADSGSGLYFSCGGKRVDFILVYNKLQLSVAHEKRRQFFQENLIKDGLEMESEYPEPNNAEGQIFVKIHAPWSTLCRQAELMHLKMPLKIQDQLADDDGSGSRDNGSHDGRDTDSRLLFTTVFKNIFNVAKRFYGGGTTKVKEFKMSSPEDNDVGRDTNGSSSTKSVNFVTQHFTRKKMNRFNIVDKDTFFSPIQRVELVFEMLQSARNNPEDERSRGVESLLDKKIYVSAYPLHDGDADSHLPKNQWCQRQFLRRTWASWGCAFRPQPLEAIRNYYGVKIGFYFAFLGFYTKWLVLPAIGGTLCFIYGLVAASQDSIVEEFCNERTEPGNYTMCPMCQPPNCEPFLMAHEGCKLIQWDIRMDNEATLVLACLSVIWATAFIKMWRRREAELALEWDTYDLDHHDVVVRPEYEEHAKERKENPITREVEPFVPRSTRILWLCVSVAVTLFLLLCVTAMLVTLVLVRIKLYGGYRHSSVHTFQHFNVEWSRWTVHGMIFVTVIIFEKIYHNVAMKLTSWECPKTQSDFISSFLWKVFLFELINDFVPIGYAAWFKGRLLNTPLDLDFKSELCDPGGCMAEVVELISVLLLARLVIGNLAEVGIPFMKNFMEHKLSAGKTEAHEHVTLPQYRKDFQLEELELDGVAEEYMEMIVQFAFVTLFVPAFPLAGMVCLLNNVAEIRVDAINFVTAHRRPLPIRVPGIEIWNKFLDIITKLAILVNAALIAFTSELFPRIVYRQNQDKYKHYGEFSLSSINMSLFHDEDIEHYMNESEHPDEHGHIHERVEICYYQDYRESTYPYKATELWWQIMLLRVTCFALFTTLFFIFHWLFNFLVSDVPSSVETKIRRRKFVVTKASENEMLDKWLSKTAGGDNKKISIWSQVAKRQTEEDGRSTADNLSNISEGGEMYEDVVANLKKQNYLADGTKLDSIENGSIAKVSSHGIYGEMVARNRLDSLTSNNNNNVTHPNEV